MKVDLGVQGRFLEVEICGGREMSRWRVNEMKRYGGRE